MYRLIVEKMDKNYLGLRTEHSVKNISGVARIYKSFGGIDSRNSFLDGKGRYANIIYDACYINRWGWDMSEVRVHTHTCSKEKALAVVEERGDIKKTLIDEGFLIQ
ncbi:MAG: hypothetical protein LBT27_05825 [Prevotellaceae bacterium]|jgi:hypothetical protein|nr:hypothetical protein [Prevotellaceae bacterium]